MPPPPLLLLNWLPMKPESSLQLVALTFEMFVVPLQLRGQKAPQGTQATERRHHGVLIVHVGIIVALPAAQNATATSSSSSSQLPHTHT